MSEVEGARTFGVAGTSYDSFMGRYSLPLAEQFADAAGVAAGDTAVDVGCGPGALTGVLSPGSGRTPCTPATPHRRSAMSAQCAIRGSL